MSTSLENGKSELHIYKEVRGLLLKEKQYWGWKREGKMKDKMGSKNEWI